MTVENTLHSYAVCKRNEYKESTCRERVVKVMKMVKDEYCLLVEKTPTLSMYTRNG